MDNGGLITNSGVAKIIGISSGSVTLWSNTHFKELLTNKQGHKLYSQEDIEYFKKVKALLKKKYRHEEIKEMLKNQYETENLQELKNDCSDNIEKRENRTEVVKNNLNKADSPDIEAHFNKIYGKYRMQIDEIANKIGFAFIKGEQPIELKEEAAKIQEKLEIVQEIRQEFQSLIYS